MNTPEQLVDGIKQIYKQGDSLHKIARDMGINRQTISHWLDNGVTPSPIYQDIIRKYLKKKRKASS